MFDSAGLKKERFPAQSSLQGSSAGCRGLAVAVHEGLKVYYT